MLKACRYSSKFNGILDEIRYTYSSLFFRHRTSRTRIAHGFSLPELLVVLATVVILISLLFVVMRNTKQKGMTVRCVGNLRQIQQATSNYLGDNRGVWMPHWISPRSINRRDNYTTSYWQNDPRFWEIFNSKGAYSWFDMLNAYFKQPDVFYCPAYENQWEFNPHNIGYGINGFFLAQEHNRDGEYSGTRLPSKINFPQSSVRRPEQCISFADSKDKISGGSNQGSELTVWWPYINRANEGINANRHPNSAVVAFTDGHVEVVKSPNQTINPARDDSVQFLEFWDPLQRFAAWK